MLGSPQRKNLIRAYKAADGLHRALQARLSKVYSKSDRNISPSASCPVADEHTRGEALQQTEGTTRQITAKRSSYAFTQAYVDLKPQRSLWDTILWVTVPDSPHFSQSSTLPIQYFPDDLNVLRHDPWLKEAPHTGLGDEMVKKVNDSIYVHQGLTTMLAVRSKKLFSVQLHGWIWLVDRLENNLLKACQDSASFPQSTVIFIHAMTEEPSDMGYVYDRIRALMCIHGAKLRPYPNESEWRQEVLKIGDIRALDEIARSAPWEYSYRPRTCFGQGPCQLDGYETTVHKRSHSYAAKHMKVLDRGSFGELTCTFEGSDKQSCKPDGSTQKRKRTLNRHQPAKRIKGSRVSRNTRPKGERPPHVLSYWFHQEFVPNLHKGEFRVFIATKPSAGGMRGRSGYVVAMAWTSWNWKDESLAIRSVLPEDFDETCTQRRLEQFSLYVFERIRAQRDMRYESFEVGARLDVGVADDTGGKRFFVNEMTRWYNGHYFSNNICPEPKTQICKAFADAFSSYVQQGMSDIKGEA